MENFSSLSYKTYTYKSHELPHMVQNDIIDLFSLVLHLRKDDLLENYKKFKIEDQEYITVQYNYDDELEHVSSIFKRDSYPKGVYRLHNRFMRNPKYRMDSLTADPELKKVIHKGTQPTHIMLNQQIEVLEKIGYKFYFFSRQVMQRRVWSKYVEKFNLTFEKDLRISDDRYWVCNGEANKCAQYIVYPNKTNIPFKKL